MLEMGSDLEFGRLGTDAFSGVVEKGNGDQARVDLIFQVRYSKRLGIQLASQMFIQSKLISNLLR